MKKTLKKFLNKKGYLVIPHTPAKDVLHLMQRLHPKKTEKELIRMGPNGDGGYLLPDDIENIEACFSPGVNQISGFEEDCGILGMKLFLADKTVDSPKTNLDANSFNFIKKHIGISNNQEYITMDEWMNTANLSATSDLILQMDIEGGEYQALTTISDKLLNRFRIIVIEFHFLHDLWNPVWFPFAKAVFDKLLSSHTVVHMHPNNTGGIETMAGIEIPRTLEITFIRNDRAILNEFQTSFPNKLDFDNSTLETVVLPKQWYKN